MFTHVMNLTMNAAIFRSGPPSGEPKRAESKTAGTTRRRSEVVARKAGRSRLNPTFQIYADAFKTAVYGG